MRHICVWGIGAALALAAAAAAAAQQDGAAEPRVFDVRVQGRSLPPAADTEVLASGEFVVLAADGERPVLTRVDLGNRAQALPVPSDVSTNYDNSVVAASDGALLFSSGGRVLRRASDGGISTVAGRRSPAKASGDGGPAVGAGMKPTGLALLPDGSLLIADRRNHRVRRVDPGGRISTVAGTGAAGNDGDGGSATQAKLTAPWRISAFPDGSYVVATGHSVLRVRRVDAAGRITTVLGPGRSKTRRRCDDGSAPARSLRFAKRLLDREFFDWAIGEGTGSIKLHGCRHQGPGGVRCIATTNYDDGDGPRREIHSLVLRPDGVLQLRVRSRRGRTLWTHAVALPRTPSPADRLPDLARSAIAAG